MSVSTDSSGSPTSSLSVKHSEESAKRRHDPRNITNTSNFSCSFVWFRGSLISAAGSQVPDNYIAFISPETSSGPLTEYLSDVF